MSRLLLTIYCFEAHIFACCGAYGWLEVVSKVRWRWRPAHGRPDVTLTMLDAPWEGRTWSQDLRCMHVLPKWSSFLTPSAHLCVYKSLVTYTLITSWLAKFSAAKYASASQLGYLGYSIIIPSVHICTDLHNIIIIIIRFTGLFVYINVHLIYPWNKSTIFFVQKRCTVFTIVAAKPRHQIIYTVLAGKKYT